MPAVKLPAKVLVSGVNGFLGSWVARTLLDQGFSVRGVVREEQKGKYLLDIFKDEVSEGRFEIVVVPDMTVSGAFDEAVKGVDAIEHTASPLHMNAVDPNDLIDPAVKGTISMLESALRHAGPQLKRIVVTSSGTTILNHESSGILSEKDWNEKGPAEVEERGHLASPFAKYSTSKILAERAAWKFTQDHKNEISWDLTVIIPTIIFGPILHEVTDPSKLNLSLAMFYGTLVSKIRSVEEVAQEHRVWVDVRDAALGHVLAIISPDAGGQRIICSGGSFIWQEWFNTANALSIPGLNVPLGTPETANGVKYRYQLDTTKARTVLGLRFRDKTTTARDTLESFRNHGWLVTS
ncbi:D-lactaldehyde dehydrogenase [Pyrrhoderma noxium]|uniref:D-lactaldehyde dehydrogenase n=1 Tax=Pyrrhoderma noxium TaxID=2282107 RepID=A0A286UDE3_9AGAM|nr:D-lactaldehyde dehydrogenase [Pyrrhoderma noxium]